MYLFLFRLIINMKVKPWIAGGAKAANVVNALGAVSIHQMLLLDAIIVIIEKEYGMRPYISVSAQVAVLLLLMAVNACNLSREYYGMKDAYFSSKGNDQRFNYTREKSAVFGSLLCGSAVVSLYIIFKR